MGCFSFLCNECGEGVNSTSFSGEMVKLFLLKDGKIIQEMEGEYDSYARVFIDGTKENGRFSSSMARDSVYWKDPDKDAKASEPPPRLQWLKEDPEWEIWGKVCDLMHKGAGQPKYEGRFIAGWYEEPVPGNGIAAIHSACFKIQPIVASERDPDQGWNKIKKKHKNPRDLGEKFYKWLKEVERR